MMGKKKIKRIIARVGNMNRLKVILFLIMIVSFLPVPLFSEDTSEEGKSEILNAEVRTLIPPQKRNFTEEIIISPDNKKILFSLQVWGKSLFNQKDRNRYLLYEHYPFKSNFISLVEGEKILADCREKQSKEEGIIIEKKENEICVTKKEFWLYQIKEGKWSTLSWQEGDALFRGWDKGNQGFSREEREAILHSSWRGKTSSEIPEKIASKFKYGIATFMKSRDKNKIIYMAILKRKPASIFPLTPPIGEYIWYALGVCSIDGEYNRVFQIKDFKAHFEDSKWSSDESFVLITKEHISSNEEKLYLLIFGKAEN